jgi:hypothetical protein
VRRYVGSNDPASRRHAEWLTVIMMDDSGR